MKCIHVISRAMLVGVLLLGGLMLSSCSQPEVDKKFTIGVLNPNKGTMDISRGFIEGMWKEGYTEQELNIIEYAYGDGCDIDAALRDLLKRNVDLLFTVTTPATKKARELTAQNNIPVVFAMFDPVQSGVVESLSRPGENLTGIKLRGSVPKTLEWLQTIAPGIKNIYVPIKFDTTAAAMSLEDLQQTAQSLGLDITVEELATREEIDPAIEKLPASINAIFLLHSILISSNTEKIIKAANKRNFPTASAIGKHKEGVLVTSSPNLYKVGQQASRLARNILQGEAPATIPVEVAEFTLSVNLRTAQTIGVEISNDNLLQFNSIIRP